MERVSARSTDDQTEESRASGLLQFLPPGLAPQHQALLLVEMAKLDMSIAADAGQLIPIETYLERLSPPLSDSQVPFDWLMEEQAIRQSLGLSAGQPIEERFPELTHLHGVPEKGLASTIETSRMCPPRRFQPGEQIDDFSIIAMLGSGSFADVYLARQISMQRLVAVKVSTIGNGEPLTLAQLDHPNIVRVYDQRRVDDGENQPLHLVYMQLVPGGTLFDVAAAVKLMHGYGKLKQLSGELLLDCVDQNLLRSAQQTPERSSLRRWLRHTTWPSVVAWIGVQLADALDHAHRQGILHRDIKPANVLITSEGIPRLADFNVSFSATTTHQGAAESLGGSPAYMAPEHLRAAGAKYPESGDAVGVQSDLFSLAVLLWELWVGRRPFRDGDGAGSWSEILDNQLRSRSTPPAAHQPELRLPSSPADRVLESVLRQGLDYDPAKRFRTSRQMTARLRIAMHPEVAELFDPPADSFRHHLLSMSPYWVMGLCILVPNIVAGIFNYLYNENQIIAKYSEVTPTIRDVFDRLALAINLVAFPLGCFLSIHFTRPIVRGLERSRSRGRAKSSELASLLLLGTRAAWIGCLLWMIAGLCYSGTLYYLIPSFDTLAALHFFASLLICGGIAAVYPFFPLTWLATKIYYPFYQRQHLIDRSFSKRATFVRKNGQLFLFAAAAIPFLGLLLLLSRDVVVKGTMLATVISGLIGLGIAVLLNSAIDTSWRKMATVFQTSDERR
ncbi:MAG: serine/threonine-protein kinase [Planctomycetota bacterium]